MVINVESSYRINQDMSCNTKSKASALCLVREEQVLPCFKWTSNGQVAQQANWLGWTQELQITFSFLSFPSITFCSFYFQLRPKLEMGHVPSTDNDLFTYLFIAILLHLSSVMELIAAYTFSHCDSDQTLHCLASAMGLLYVSAKHTRTMPHHKKSYWNVWFPLRTRGASCYSWR